MKKLAAFLLPAVLLTACGTQTASSGETDTPNTSAETGSAAFAAQGYDSAEAAYTAYLEAVLAGDSDAFTGVFSAEEVSAAPNAPQDFLKDYYEIDDISSYQQSVLESAFQKQTKRYLSSMQSAMEKFGEKGDEWSYLPGTPVETEESLAGDFAAALGLNITGAELHEIFFLDDQTRDASASGKRVLLLEIDGGWYPSYVHECVGTKNWEFTFP